ncbi:MAG TPA: hypothetical protein VE996_12530 [Terriglobales bacterium]|nr:hypothetical protein [Terriglobales bacterium]
MGSEQTERILANFIATELAPGTAPAALAAHQALFESVLDSGNVLDLVSFIEERFALTIDDLEITPANFGSLGRLTAFIARKRQAAVAAAPARAGSV